MKRLLLAATTVFSVAWAAQPAVTHAASAPISFGLAPGNQKPPKYFFDYTVTPGQSLNDTVAVINPNNTPLTVKLSTSDAFTRLQGGGISFRDGSQQRAVGRWVHLQQTTATVAPKHVLFVGLSLTVPASAKPGEYEGTINATNTQAQTIISGKIGFKIHGTVRCIVLLRVAGKAKADLRVTRVAVVRANQQNYLGIGLLNAGTVFVLPATTTVTLAGASTVTLHPIISTILGGDATTIIVPLDQHLAPGTYRVRIQITYQAHLEAGGQFLTMQRTWYWMATVPAR